MFSFPKPFVFKGGMNSNSRDDLTGHTGMKKPLNQRLGYQSYGQGGSNSSNNFNNKNLFQSKR